MARTAGSTAEGTRQRILDAATKLFEQRGFAGTSIRELAVLCGMTKAALYYHFPSKEEVLQALVAPFLDDVDRIVAATAAGQWTRAELVKRLITQMNERGEFINAVLSDPSVKHAMFERLGMSDRMERLIQVLAGADDQAALLRGRCAMGALMSGLLHHGTQESDEMPHGPLLSPDEQKVVCEAVLAVLECDVGGTPGTMPWAGSRLGRAD